MSDSGSKNFSYLDIQVNSDGSLDLRWRSKDLSRTGYWNADFITATSHTEALSELETYGYDRETANRLIQESLESEENTWSENMK